MGVETIGAAAALISAAGAFAQLFVARRSDDRKKAFERAAPEDIPRMLAEVVPEFDIDVRALSAEQQYALALQQLLRREREQRRKGIIFLILAGILGLVTLVATLVASPNASSIIDQNVAPGGVGVIGSGNHVGRNP
jgi:hypothetical protein